MKAFLAIAGLTAGLSLAGVTAASAGGYFVDPDAQYFAPAPVYEPPEVIVREKTYIVRRPQVAPPPAHIYLPRHPVYAGPAPVRVLPAPTYGEPYTRRVTKRTVTIEEGPAW
jgi:hypothetical protein